jgi:outer membrane protein TolC
MFEIGSVAQGDVFRARTTYGNDRINLIAQKNQVNNARGLLNVTLGRPADAELNIVDIEVEPQYREYSLDEVLKVAVEQNPELESFKYEMRRAELGRKIARTAYLPSFSVSASYRRAHNEPRFVYGDFSKNWLGEFGLGVRWNLFNGFSDHAEIDAALSYRIAEERHVDRAELRLEAEGCWSLQPGRDHGD